MSRNNPTILWTNILDLLGSDKIKERTDGLAEVRKFLASTRNVEYLNSDPKHSWTTSLQVFYELVRNEQNTVHRGGRGGAPPPATSVKRLDEAAGAVRLVVDKVHERFKKKAAKGLFKHLSQMICVSGGKLPTYALTYLRTLRIMLNYLPHLEHIEQRSWTDIVSLCFAAALGDPIKIGQEFMDEQLMDLDDDDHDGRIGGKNGERVGPALREGVEDGNVSRSRRTATQEDIELLSCIDAAFKCTAAPLLKCADVILVKFLRFFKQFEIETTAHLPALSALNRTFAALELNNQAVMMEFGPQLWPHIIALWTTKNTAFLKEQVIIALKYLLPFVAPRDLATPSIEFNVNTLFSVILEEPSIRWRTDELSIDCLRLGMESEQSSSSSSRAFTMATIRCGHSFSGVQVMAWGMLELGADVLARLYTLSQNVKATNEDQDDAIQGSSKKKRTLDDALSNLLEYLREDQLPSSITFRLQLLLFFIERHWSLLHLAMGQRILRTLVLLLSCEDQQIQCWTLMAIAAIAHHSPPSDNLDASWDQIWAVATRKISIPTVSRSAAHTANILLSSRRIASPTIAASIEALARDLSVQGPSFPSDSICTYLSHCLTIASNDVQLCRLQLPEAVLAWLSSGWKPLEGINRAFNIGQTKPRSDPLSAADVCALVFRVCHLEKVPRVEMDFVVPDSPLTTMMIAGTESEVLRSFALDARLPEYAMPGSRGDVTTETTSLPALRGAAVGLGRKVSKWMEKSLVDLTDEARNGGDLFWATISVEKARRMLDFVTMAFVIEGALSMNKVLSSRTTIKAACSLLFSLIPVLNFKKWSLFERASILAGISPLFVSVPEYQPVEYVALLDPGPASGIAQHLVPPPSTHLHPQADFTSAEYTLLSSIWRGDLARPVFEALRQCLQLMLTGSYAAPALPPLTQMQFQGGSTQLTQATQTQLRRDAEAELKEDDFGEIRVAEAPTLVGKSKTAYTDRASDACVSICVRGLLSVEMMDSAPQAALVPALVEAIIESEGEVAIVVAEHVFTAVLMGVMRMEEADMQAILTTFGGLLMDYRFAADERFALVALRLLECTATTWILDDEEEGDTFASHSRKLCSWYAEKIGRDLIPSWKVKLRFIAFLDYYLTIDTAQAHWNRITTSDDGMVAAPTAIIPNRLRDEDFRVRFRAATSSSALFNFMHINRMPTEARGHLLQDVSFNLDADNQDQFEGFLTTVICYGSLIMVDATRRRSAYDYLLRLASQSKEYGPHIEATLKGIALRLGLPHLSSLYTYFARYITARSQTSGQLLVRFPPSVCGLSDSEAMANATFRQVGTIFLIEDGLESEFKRLCKITHRAEDAGMVECFAEVIALVLLRYFTQEKMDLDDVGAGEGTLIAQIMEFAQRAGVKDAAGVTAMVSGVADQLIASMLLHVCDLTWEPEQAVKGLNSIQNQTFKSILDLTTRLEFYEPTPPFYPSANVISALNWFASKYPVAKSPSTIYSIVHDLFVKVQSAPFVNDQQRFLFSISLLLSWIGIDMIDATVLGLLAESLVILLPKFDLAPRVSAILRWSILQWLLLLEREGAEATSGEDLCANLLRAAHVCEALRKEGSGDVEITHVCVDLRNTLDHALHKLAELGEPTLLEACLLWPPPLTYINPPSLKEIKDILSSSFSPVGKFGITRTIRRQEKLDVGPSGLWRLLESISPSTTPELEDCVAFAELAHRSDGRIVRPSLSEVQESPVDETDLSKLLAEDESIIKIIIVDRLLNFLRNSDLQLVHLASDTLRSLIFVTENLDLPASASTRSQGIFDHLANAELARPQAVRQARTRSLKELKTNEKFLNADGNYGDWIKRLTQLLSDYRSTSGPDPFYAQLVPLLDVNVDISTLIFPQLVHSILYDGILKSDFNDQQLLSDYLSRLLRHPATSTACIHVIVDLAVYLRHHTQPSSDTPLSCDEWLKIPWILLAEAAVKCKAHLTALLFIELANEHDQSEGGSITREQAVLYDIYAEIDEPDGFYGRQSKDVRQALTQRYHHEERWSRAFRLHGADFESQDGSKGGSAATLGVLKSLASFGFNRLATSILQPFSSSRSIPDVDVPAGLPYDLAWKTDSWDLPIQTSAAGTSSVALYSALRSVHADRDSSGLMQVVESGIVSEMKKLGTVNLELPMPNYDALSTLLALNEVRKWAIVSKKDALDAELLARMPMVSDSFQFSHADKILSTRISLLRSVRVREQSDQIGDITSPLHQEAARTERACYLRLSELSRLGGHLQTSMNAITLAQNLLEVGERSDDVEEEFANVLWSQGEHKTAIDLLEGISLDPRERKAAVSARLGTWTSSARLKNSKEILKLYFEPSVAALNDANSPNERSEVYHAFAIFADSQYQEANRVALERQERFELYDQRKQAELAEITRQLSKGVDSGLRSQLQKGSENARASLEEDQAQLREATEIARVMLCQALKNYAQALVAASSNDDDMLRYTSLWLAHADDDELNKETIAGLVASIPPHKFIFLFHQLSARLHKSSNDSPFVKIINQLVCRICAEHPFHSIYQINALRTSDPTLSTPIQASSSSARQSGRRSSASSASTNNTSAQNQSSPRSLAADAIITKVLKTKPALKGRIDAIIMACEAYYDWAEFRLSSVTSFLGENKKVKKGLLKLPAKCGLVKLKDLPIPVSSYTLPVDVTTKYDQSDIPYIARYQSTFFCPGGVSEPKVVKCVGTNGKVYSQLLKGKDDPRQDTVMEQAFVLINDLLQRDERTRSRGLRIRTYKIIPLGPTSSLIEFVDRTKALGEVISEAYAKYYPNLGMTPSAARQMMNNAEKKTGSPEEMTERKLKQFRKIMAQLPPVYRHVALQSTKSPTLWFDQRLNYSRSVATNSIVGYTFGVGDRHPSNILVDQVTGELIHIDLGIAFDQGRRLRIPELVPFRLTSNIIDGFGMTGVDGVFRRCAEETLRVLRDRSDVVMTVLEVFKHDPLQSWGVTLETARRIQGSEEETGKSPVDYTALPDDADRALGIVKAKLSKDLSLEHRVNELINEATDFNNLALIFSGWQCAI